jgi:hypothetical protein
MATEAAMKGWIFGVLAGTTLAACGSNDAGSGGGIGSAGSNDTTVQIYGQTFQFTSPVNCSVFVVQRIVDTIHDVAEYDARTSPGAETIEATYSLAPKDAYPVHVDVTQDKGLPLFSVAMGPHDLKVLDPAKNVALSVKGYDGTTPAVTQGTWTGPTPDGGSALSDAIAILQCMLPVQVALGAIPSFFENRSERVGKGGIVGSANDAPPVLPTWNGARTLLGAYFTAAACLQPGPSGFAWQCTCPQTQPDALLGDLSGLCGLSRR